MDVNPVVENQNIDFFQELRQFGFVADFPANGGNPHTLSIEGNRYGFGTGCEGNWFGPSLTQAYQQCLAQGS